MEIDLSYPVGPFTPMTPVTASMRASAIDDLAALPRRMQEAIDQLNDRQLDTPYRPGGWTVRQVVHHVADSHMNAFSRMKLALTEETPTIKPYEEKAFATLADMRLPVEVSLDLLSGLHERWVAIHRALRPEQYLRAFFHPELGKALDLETFLQMYSWHSRHHVAHITALRKREGW
jgi:DinB family protein